MTLRGLTKSMQCKVVEGFRQCLAKGMPSIEASDPRFSTLRVLSKGMRYILPMKTGTRAFSSGSAKCT